MTLHGMKYPFGHSKSALLAMLSPGFLCTSSLADHRKLKSPGFGVSTTKQELKYESITNTIPTKHSTGPATRKNINPILADTIIYKMITLPVLYQKKSDTT